MPLFRLKTEVTGSILEYRWHEWHTLTVLGVSVFWWKTDLHKRLLRNRQRAMERISKGSKR
jgi:hypothetical protein